MHEVTSLPTPASGEGIRIFDGPGEPLMRAKLEGSPLLAYVTIGAGETHVTLLDAEGRDIFSWTAVYGWAEFSTVETETVDGGRIELRDEDMIARAMSGSLAVGGRTIDTTPYVGSVVVSLNAALRDIFARTVETEELVSGIVFAAPIWLHSIMRCGATGLRDDIHPEIVDMP